MGATTALAIYAASVPTAALGWQVFVWLRGAAAATREKEGAATGAVLAALDDVLVATGRSHGERIHSIMADQSDKPVREIWRPDRQLSVETDQQLARALIRLIRRGRSRTTICETSSPIAHADLLHQPLIEHGCAVGHADLRRTSRIGSAMTSDPSERPSALGQPLARL
jgi:hypothetical protein